MLSTVEWATGGFQQRSMVTNGAYAVQLCTSGQDAKYVWSGMH